MRNNYNKKKITFISKFKLIKYLFIFLIFILASFYFYDYILEKKIHREIIQEFSKKNDFVLASYETNELIRVDQSEVSRIINKYFGKSIFLIPLRDLSNQIRELNWVKDVNLSNNFKSKIFVEILEYEPLGLFFFNDKIYYFSKEGKIIDQFKENDENFIIFSGKNTLKHARKSSKSAYSLEKSRGLRCLSKCNERGCMRARQHRARLSLSDVTSCCVEQVLGCQKQQHGCFVYSFLAFSSARRDWS